MYDFMVLYDLWIGHEVSACLIAPYYTHTNEATNTYIMRRFGDDKRSVEIIALISPCIKDGRIMESFENALEGLDHFHILANS